MDDQGICADEFLPVRKLNQSRLLQTVCKAKGMTSEDVEMFENYKSFLYCEDRTAAWAKTCKNQDCWISVGYLALLL